MPPDQGELDWNAKPGGVDGLEAWHRQRRDAVRDVGKALGLPLGRTVDLELKDGCRMRGLLCMAEDGLFIDASRERPPLLRIDRCTFLPGDIARCVRVD
jgi:hypothetical protein